MPGKKSILRDLVDASLSETGRTVTEMIFGAVPDGEETLSKLTRELMTT